MKIVELNLSAKTYRGPWEWADGSATTDIMVPLEDAVKRGFKPEGSVVIVPESVEMWQFRTIADQRGLTPKIQSYIDAQPEPPRLMLKNLWEYAPYVERHNDFVESIGELLGFSPEQMDQFFIAADALSNQL